MYDDDDTVSDGPTKFKKRRTERENRENDGTDRVRIYIYTTFFSIVYSEHHIHVTVWWSGNSKSLGIGKRFRRRIS